MSATIFTENPGIITTEPFPNSQKKYVSGVLFPEIRVPVREVKLSPTKASSFAAQQNNEPVLIYDTSGPYTDPDMVIDVAQGLKPIRSRWIEQRSDTKLYQGRINELAGQND